MTPDKLLRKRPPSPPLIPGDLEQRLLEELDARDRDARELDALDARDAADDEV